MNTVPKAILSVVRRDRGAGFHFACIAGKIKAMKWVMAALLALGGAMCCLNFFLSFLRYPIHRMRGKSKESYRWVSGFPVFGSLFVAISLIAFWKDPFLRAAAIILILIDTGGLHWFAGVQLWNHLNKSGKDRANST